MIRKKRFSGSMKMINNSIASQVAATNTGFISSFLSNPSAIVSTVATLINIILFIINAIVIRRNAKVEFNRKIKLSYYEITVITAMKDLLRIISLIRSEYYQLKYDYIPQSNKTLLRKNCEKHLNKIDEYIASMEHNACMLIQVYSEESSKNLQKIIEKFDDSCIDIVSKYSCNLKVRKIDYYTEMFNAAVSKTIKGIHDVCRNLAP